MVSTQDSELSHIWMRVVSCVFCSGLSRLNSNILLILGGIDVIIWLQSPINCSIRVDGLMGSWTEIDFKATGSGCSN